MISLLSLKPKAGCACERYAKHMDLWGPTECRRRQRIIVDHLRDNAKRYGFHEWLKAGLFALWNRLPLTLEGLVEEAISRAEKE